MAVAKEKRNISSDDILSASNGGWDIFKHEIGKFPVSRAFRHPLYQDKCPSAAIVCRGGVWFLKDFSEEYPTMTAVQFVQKKYGLTFPQTIEKLAIQYGVKEGVNQEYQPVKIEWKPPIPEDSEITYNFDTTKWRKQHFEFWEGTGVTPKHCEKYNTWAVKEILVNKRRLYMHPDEVVWAYYAEDIDKVKFYFPQRKKGQRFKGNVPGGYIWNLDRIVKCRKLMVIKSMKDLLCNTIMFPCTISVQSESAKIFTDDVIERINKIAKRVYVSFGSDPQGVEQSVIITQKTGWGWVNPPKEYLPEINDTYGLEKAYGIDAWVQCLKNKNII